MKKTLFIALMASFTVNAQVRERNDIEIAPFVGINSSITMEILRILAIQTELCLHLFLELPQIFT